MGRSSSGKACMWVAPADWSIRQEQHDKRIRARYRDSNDPHFAGNSLRLGDSSSDARYWPFLTSLPNRSGGAFCEAGAWHFFVPAGAISALLARARRPHLYLMTQKARAAVVGMAYGVFDAAYQSVVGFRCIGRKLEAACDTGQAVGVVSWAIFPLGPAGAVFWSGGCVLRSLSTFVGQTATRL